MGAARVVSSGCQVGIRVVSETLQSYAEWIGDNADPDSRRQRHRARPRTAAWSCILGGRPLDIQGLVADATTKAIVMAWYPGSEGLGVAEVLYGVDGANFTGKLPVTWKVDATETPVNFCDGAGVDADANGTPDACEDVGAHYSNTASPPATVLFPYGFGLSYGPPNVPPTVSITAPLSGASVVAGSTITISANAADSDGTVSSVTFLDGATQIGVPDTTSPYSVSWTVPAAPGSHSLTARAADNGGATTTSAAVGDHRHRELHRHVQERQRDRRRLRRLVHRPSARTAGPAPSTPTARAATASPASAQAPANVPPTVSITAPVNGASVVAGSTITISANAADSDGTVSSVTFFAGATQIGVRTRPRPTA